MSARTAADACTLLMLHCLALLLQILLLAFRWVKFKCRVTFTYTGFSISVCNSIVFLNFHQMCTYNPY